MNIVTHRFRGFSSRENSFEGFRNALEANVKYFEFDVRLTADGIPVINHDRYFESLSGRKVDIVTTTQADIEASLGKGNSLGGIMTLNDALDLFKSKKGSQSRIFIDIKDFGGEKRILEEINNRKLDQHVVIVSWLPEVLFAVHKIDTDLPLCFSHNYIASKLQFDLMKQFLTDNTVKHIIGGLASIVKPSYATELKNISFFFEDYNKRENEPGMVVSSNRDFEHTLNGPVTGRLYEIIERSKGFLCIQHMMLDERYAGFYSCMPGIIPYSINNTGSLDRLPKNLDYPFILSDNPDMVSRY